jgi:hypothetical protein
MDKEVPPALERENQILAAAANVYDAFASQRGCDRFRRLRAGEARVGDLDALERAAGERRRKPGADRLDFRELGHGSPGRASAKDAKDERDALWLLVLDPEARGDFVDGAIGGRVVRGVDLRHRLAGLDTGSALG